MIVATDGRVKHVHVIRASAAQRRNIEEAVRQWKFKPYVKQGHPAEVETGVMFNLNRQIREAAEQSRTRRSRCQAVPKVPGNGGRDGCGAKAFGRAISCALARTAPEPTQRSLTAPPFVPA